jgi:hypothetical protein
MTSKKILSAAQLAKREYQAGRSAASAVQVEHFMGAYYLADSDYHLLADASFPSRDAANAARSKILDKARKYIA